MFSDNAQARPSDFDASEASLRFRTMFAELWHDWFEAMSEVAYQTHRACEFLAENGSPLNGRQSPFDFFRSRSPSEGLSGSVDMDKLQQCLRSMDPMQAAQVMHAVQMMQAMEAILKRRRARTEETEGAAW